LAGSFCHMSGRSRRTFIRRQTGFLRFSRVTNMAVTPHPIHIVDADRCHEGILIRFADGTMFFYGSDFLYEHRAANGNWEIAEDPGHDWDLASPRS
jgi:hypothetical protein